MTNKEYTRIKKSYKVLQYGTRNVPQSNIRKSFKALVFSMEVLAACAGGLAASDYLLKRVQIEETFEPVRKDANEIVEENRYPAYEHVYDCEQIAKNIQKIEEQRGKLYSKAVLVRVLDLIDSSVENYDAHILKYLEIEAENFEDYARQNGFTSAPEMVKAIKKEFVEHNRVLKR